MHRTIISFYCEYFCHWCNSMNCSTWLTLALSYSPWKYMHFCTFLILLSLLDVIHYWKPFKCCMSNGELGPPHIRHSIFLILYSFRWFSKSSNAFQSPGLLTLLISRATNIMKSSIPDLDQFGISPNQRALAEIVETINMAHLIHSEVVDLSTTTNDNQGKGTVSLDTVSDNDRGNMELGAAQNSGVDSGPQLGNGGTNASLASDIAFGNKLLIIGGDLLLARACKNLATLYNPQVTCSCVFIYTLPVLYIHLSHVIIF